MKKIPTVFKRVFEGHKIVDILDEITPGCEDAFYNGVATIKYDGSCCAKIDGRWYKRYDAKKGKKPPEGAIPCCDPDPVTGHHPHWVLIDPMNPSDKWFIDAIHNTLDAVEDGTYEAIGPHFNGNPYDIVNRDILIKHGERLVIVERDFFHIREFLRDRYIEGLVFWLDGEPVCKIKTTDFGFKWGK